MALRDNAWDPSRCDRLFCQDNAAKRHPGGVYQLQLVPIERGPDNPTDDREALVIGRIDARDLVMQLPNES